MVPASSSLIMKALDEPVRNRKEEKNSALRAACRAALPHTALRVLWCT